MTNGEGAASRGRREASTETGTEATPAGVAQLNRGPAHPTLGRFEPSWLAAEQAPYYLLLGTTAFLLLLGLVMVFSASSVTSYAATGSSFAVVQKQLLWAALGLPAAWAATRLPPAAYRRAAYPLLVLSVVLLAAVQVPGLGRTVNGSRNWLALGGLSLQPSELAKLALILWSADLLARKTRLLGRLRHLLVPLLPAGLGVLALVLAGGDLGTSIVLIAILGGLLYLAGAPGRVFAAFGALAAAGVVAMIVYQPYRMARVTTLFHPGADPAGAGYQGLQGSYALAGGGWWGVGLGASVAKWGFLPEAHTDFIFAIIGEELGLAGTLCVLALFALVTYAGCRIVLAATDVFTRLTAGGITIWITVQALVNIGAVIGLVPITGIPLPLISYGGTALVVDLTAIGVLLSFARPPTRPPNRRRFARPPVLFTLRRRARG